MNNSNGNKGITFLELLTIAFIVLKLIGKINWSWWIVLSPMLFAIVVGIIVLFAVAIIDSSNGMKKYKK